MAKTKNKKRNLAESNQKKKEAANVKKLNPFEVHIHKEKLRVLGQKSKNDRGLPGVSRAKALKKRKNTLLQEYRHLHKSNKFTDRRIGENNFTMTEEERTTARFTAVRMKGHNKKSIYNLGDDDVTLTHKGQSLLEIEKFDDPRSDEDEEDDNENEGNLGADFVGDAHFGGGILTRTNKDGALTHKELIEQLILESKKRKAEKQKIKEATVELTEKLDSEWKDLLPLVNKSRKNEERSVGEQKVDDYDRLMREMKFEARGTVSDRLKTEDEIAKEEKQKLEELEKERLERMRGFVDDNAKKTHRSADDLDDDIVYEADPDYELSYNAEGAANVEVEVQINGRKVGEENNDQGQEVVEEDDEEEEEEESEADSEDSLSDLKNDSEDSDQDEVTEELPKEKFLKKLEKIKVAMEKAREELPYTFDFPTSYEALQTLFQDQPPIHQGIIIERLIKCNHPSLGEGNKDKLGLLFAYLLQYINDCGSEALDESTIKQCFEIFSNLSPKLFELASLNPQQAHQAFKEVIKEKYEEYRKKPKRYPNLEVLLFLKLVSLLFSTSDFRHQVVTPCFIFIEQMLHNCKVQNRKDMAYGLFLVTLILEYTSLSMRYLPDAITYLEGVLQSTLPKLIVLKLRRAPQQFNHGLGSLILNENCDISDYKMSCMDLLINDIDDSFKVRIVFTALKLIEEFNLIYLHLPSNVEIFGEITKILHLISAENWPETVQKQLKITRDRLEKSRVERKLEYIVPPMRKPKALRLLEPKIEAVFDGKRHKTQSREKVEREKLLYKLKKETKGALREIRRDQSFLGRVKINQQVQSDKERREKVKRIFAEASIQQSELNTLDRKKKNK